MRRLLRSWVMTLVPGAAISLALLIVVAGVGEIYMRRTIPFRTSTYPQRYVPDAGLVTFTPGAEVRTTNSISYWTSETANSLGFLDREPRSSGDPAACRVVVIGDSIVEAAQVPNAVKMQARLERHLSDALHGRPVEVVAAATAGVGQINELPYLQLVVAKMRPSLVILVTVSNDFSNNSAVLSALRYGWHPDHFLRYALRRDAAGGDVIQVGPDPNGNQHYLFMPADGTPLRRARVNAWMMENSYLYDWLFRLTVRSYPGIQTWLTPDATTGVDTEVRRMDQIRAIPHYRDVFAGWNFPDDLWEDYVFRTDDLPPLFQEAEWLTSYAFRQFRDAGTQQGFHVIVVSTDLTAVFEDLQALIREAGAGDALTPDGRLTRPVKIKNRNVLPTGALDRLKRIADDLGLPVVDVESELSKMPSPASARIPHDGHWSVVGHDRVAQILASYIAQHPGWCDRSAATADP
jgi:hypothetical protein